ncbi:MAG: peptidoglycan-binding protein [Treponema sp.]|jgi:hypothetical protein|nr:peptidoglycan-binding protein [Treponema sp.]
MTCHEVKDKLYEAGREEALPLMLRVRIMAHLFGCSRCMREARNLKIAQQLMAEDFFPTPPLFEDRVMASIYDEAAWETPVSAPDPHAISLRSWVITGFVIVISLATSFFGMNFIEIAAAQGLSFLLPVGLTIGCIVTGYGALFIGSHLKELSDRFLH